MGDEKSLTVQFCIKWTLIIKNFWSMAYICIMYTLFNIKTKALGYAHKKKKAKLLELWYIIYYWMCHSSLQTEGGMTFLHEKHGFKWGMKKIPVNGKIPMDGH